MWCGPYADGVLPSCLLPTDDRTDPVVEWEGLRAPLPQVWSHLEEQS